MPLRGRFLNILGSVCALAVLAMLPRLAMTAEVPRMTKEELKALLGGPELIILDVRAGSDWDDSEWKIPGAPREDPKKEVQSWADRYLKEKTLVLYCAWLGEGTSARVAQELISMGFKKVHALKGGSIDWYEANFPREAK